MQDDWAALIAEALGQNTMLKKLELSADAFREEGFKALAAMLRTNSTMQSLVFAQRIRFEDGMQPLARALVGHKSLQKLLWPNMREQLAESCSRILMEGNGSLLNCGNAFVEVCERNRKMRNKAREAVQTLRVLRNGKPNVFHLLPKDVVKMIGVLVWESRTEVAIWGEKKK